MHNFEGLNVNNKFFIDYVTSEKIQKKEDDSNTNDSILSLQEESSSNDIDFENLTPITEKTPYKTMAYPSDDGGLIFQKPEDTPTIQTMVAPSDDGGLIFQKLDEN